MQPTSERDQSHVEGALRAFDSSRHSLIAALRQLEELSRDRAGVLVADLVRTAAWRLEEMRFTLVVMGEFKRGKSSLINALLGADLMPVGVTPVTSVPVNLEHGTKASCLVALTGGERIDLDLDDLAEYASERSNPGNQKGVHSIHVRHPAKILEHGVASTRGSGQFRGRRCSAPLTVLFRPSISPRQRGQPTAIADASGTAQPEMK